MLTIKPSRGTLLAALPALLIVAACGDSGTTSTSSGGSGGSSTASTGAQTTATTSGVTTGTGGTGGVPSVDATDQCPGNVLELNLDQSSTLHGTTAGATDDYKEFCGDADASTSSPDVVYQVKIDQRCSFFVGFDDKGSFDGAIAIRDQACDTASGTDVCINLATDGESYKTELAPGTYYVIVDGGSNAQSGDFDLTLTCATPQCGDGVQNSAEEQCDPGGANPNDNCGDPGTVDACKIVSAKAADTCADITSATTIGLGQTMYLPPGSPLFNTLDATDDYEGSCSNPGAGAQDQVFEFVPTATGTLSITVGQDYNNMDYCQPPYDQQECFIHTMWVKSANCDNGLELACVYSDVVNDNDVNTIQIPVIGGTSYYLFVEGDSSSTMIGENGSYLLRASLN